MALTKDQQEAVNALIGNNLAGKKGEEQMAKYLLEDFMFLLLITMMKLICSKMESPEICLNDLKNGWLERATAILESEKKKFQDSIFRAIQAQKTVDDEMQKRMNEFFNSYCLVKDNALNAATQAVDNMIQQILGKDKTDGEKH